MSLLYHSSCLCLVAELNPLVYKAKPAPVHLPPVKYPSRCCCSPQQGRNFTSRHCRSPSRTDRRIADAFRRVGDIGNGVCRRDSYKTQT